MAKREKISAEREQVVNALLETYDIKSAEDIQEALKDLLGDTLKKMLEVELDEHLGYEKGQKSSSTNSRNGFKDKKIRTHYGEVNLSVPQDRESSFEPMVVQKRQKDISRIEQQIISMYARGLTTRQISDQIEEIYGFDVSESFVSNVTNKILPEIIDWQNRPLDDVYPIIFIDAVHFAVRHEKIIKKLAAYVVLGISKEGKKEVLGLYIGENESSKYWLGILNELKNRGVKDILIMCADGLSGIKESIQVAFPNTEYQRCIVHQVRNTLKYVSHKEKKSFAADLRSIYTAPTEEKGHETLLEVQKKWEDRYPNSMKSWIKNWDILSPIYKFSPDVRKVIYTTNAIESLNSTYKRLNSQRSVFPSDQALLKALYLSTKKATEKWKTPLRNWGKVYGELSIMYDGRLPE
ncbi:IS256 family transposase [Ilyobacter sp.]|uniref:IS256 family transposase n=1 Tax=Ilyobacter sp. TaxID=3100343 RepID=UPI00356181B9